MPDAAGDIDAAWKQAMRTGAWAAAWRLSDAVLAARAPEDFDRPWTPYHTRCVWDGRPFAGRRVLIRCYHGLGDAIQFLRYGADLRRLGCTVFVEAPPALLPLIRRSAWAAAVRPLGGADDLSIDAALECMELPHAFRTAPATVPARVPYLPVGAPERAGGDGVHVGFVWRAGDWDPRRSVPPAALAPLIGLPGIRAFGLQPDAEPGLLDRLGMVGAARPTLPALAARLRGLDLLVTVDTMAAHLAGALGVPVWTLLHAEADWRWGTGDRTPWYPTMRLFRQERPGARPQDWSAPIAAMAALLATATRAGTGCAALRPPEPPR